MRPTRLDYCQFLISSQVNYTLTNFADHSQQFSHDQLNRLLNNDKLTPRLVWEQTRQEIVLSDKGMIVFDDTVLDKNFSFAIQLVRRQYSGNAHGIIKGIGVVTCVYVNPELKRFWLLDYRIFAPDEDGNTKLDHVQQMYDSLLEKDKNKELSFSTVLMDTWYATTALMLHIERTGKLFYCPIKVNRQVDQGESSPSGYQRVDRLEWSQQELESGKSVHLKGFPAGHRLQLFRFAVSTDGTDYVVTNDRTQCSAVAAQQVCSHRWSIEQLHREVKQLTGFERCQCRRSRAQRNHIACALLVWCRLTYLAYKTGKTIYQLKHGQLSQYLIAQLKRPTIPMKFA